MGYHTNCMGIMTVTVILSAYMSISQKIKSEQRHCKLLSWKKSLLQGPVSWNIVLKRNYSWLNGEDIYELAHRWGVKSPGMLKHTVKT